MLESIRKYQWLMIAVFVLLGAGFLFTFNSFDSGRGGSAGGQTLIKADGRSYDRNAFRRLGPNTIQLAQMLNFGQMSALLGGNPYQPNIQQFVVNRLIVQDEAKKLGLYPSNEQVKAEIQEKIFFQDEKFDLEGYTNMTTRILPNLGMSERDLFALVADKIAIEKMVDVIGAGLAPSADLAKEAYLEEAQKLTLQRFEFSVADVKDGIEVTDEEVKAYWAENTSNYMTEPTYKIAYVMSQPDYPEDEPADAEKAKELSDEEKATAAAEKAAARTAAEDAATQKIDDFYVALTQNDGEDFEKHAAQAGLTVVTTTAFTPSSLPAELSGRIINDRETLIKKIQETSSSLDSKYEIDHISDAYELPGKKFVVFRALETTAAQPQEFEAAQEEAKKDLIVKKAEDTTKEKAEEARTKLIEALKTEEDVVKAGESLELVATKIGPFGARERVPQEFNASRLFSASKLLKTGEASEVVFDGSRAIFAIVTAKEIEKSDTMEDSITQQQDSMASFNRYSTFTNWLIQKTEEFGVESNLVTEQ